MIRAKDSEEILLNTHIMQTDAEAVITLPSDERPFDYITASG